MNFEFVAVSDIWNRRRDEGAAYIQKVCGNKVEPVSQQRRAVCPQGCRCCHLIATADFQHALHGVEAVQSRARCLRGEAHCPHDGGCAGLSRGGANRQEKLCRSAPSAAARPAIRRRTSTSSRANSATSCGRDDLERQSARPLAPAGCRASIERSRTRTGSATCSTVLTSRSMRASTSSSACSGPTPPGFPINGWSTRSTPFTGSPAIRIRAAWWPMAGSICGRMAARTGTP